MILKINQKKMFIRFVRKTNYWDDMFVQFDVIDVVNTLKNFN